VRGAACERERGRAVGYAGGATETPSKLVTGFERRARVAVINDDTAFLELMRDLLENEAHYDVLICKEWDAAYQFVRDTKPDLILQDIRIGGEEHGWTILNLLTLDPRTRPIPMIVCSAAIQSLHEHQEWLSRYGIRALPKPFDLDTLLETIQEMLAPRRGGQTGGDAK
jgi:CheY-like chemotaxis protein